MSIELPYPGPNHVWSIGEKIFYPKKGDPEYPEDWNENRRGMYHVYKPALTLNRYYIQGQDSGQIQNENGIGFRVVPLFTEENANEWTNHLSNSGKLRNGPIEPVGPWYTDHEEEVVRFEGGFLGMGRKRIVTREKKLLGWQFKKTTPEIHKFLPEGFTQRNVLEAAQDALAEKRNSDHERALRMESERHFGFYPPKKLSEQFPDKA